MEKTSDVSNEQIAHDLAVQNTFSKLANKESYTAGEVYELYVQQKEIFQQIVDGYANGTHPSRI